MQPAGIGPFEIVRELSRGGMGAVFLARDTRLGRLVVIKSLPEHLASDADRLSRFQREAKILSALNHPGIGAIYGVEEAAGAGGSRRYLILEYVEGQTLDERLRRGSLPPEEAFTIAQRIAEALEAAHERAVIHRDLKPGNVMVTAEGAIKLLDFGVARAQEAHLSAPTSPGVATVKTPSPDPAATRTGTVLGSPGYMSPEQALGKPIDKRSDIFAFGCVLYEMLAGTRAFSGENGSASLAAVLHLEPDWSRLPASTPVRIRDLLKNLTAKDRRQRLHDIGDARLTLERVIQSREWERSAGDSGSGRARHPIARALAWALAAASIALAGAAIVLTSKADSQRASSRAIVRLRADDGEAPLRSVTDTAGLAVTSDGTHIAYQTTLGSQVDFTAIRRTDDFTVQCFPRPATDMIFRPDGNLIVAHGNLVVACPSGGEPLTLYEGPRYVASKGCAWSPRGILFCPSPNSGVTLIPEKGGQPRTITVPDPARHEVSHRWPDVLPDGRHVLITIKKEDILTFDDAEIALLDLDTGTWKTIIRGGAFARYAPTGHIIYARNSSILAVPFEAASGSVTGSPVTVVNGVTMSPGSGGAKFAIARDAGTLVYVPGGNDEQRLELVWIDMNGKIEPVGAPVMPYAAVAPSPDGTRIAASVFGASDAIFVYDMARRTNTRLTFRGNCSGPMWRQGGASIGYVSDAEGPAASYLVSADGSGAPERVVESSVRNRRCVGMVDGRPVIVFEENGDILLQPVGSASRQPLVATQFLETEPRISPNGRWISYASNETGQFAIYIRPFPTGEGRWQAFTGGSLHCWAPDGSAIYCYNAASRQYSRVSFQDSPRVEIGSPQPMFTIPPDVGLAIEPHPDGTKFLSARNLPPRVAADQVCVVLNWFDELRAKVPVGSRPTP